MLSIETERLILRRFTLGDMQDIFTFSSDPAIAKYLEGFPGPTLEVVRAYIEQQNTFEPGELDKCFDLAIHLKSENKVIGLVTLICREHYQGEIGYALNTAYHHQGYAAEAVRAVFSYAFSTLKMHRIYAKTDRQNINSWMLMERVGMRREGVFLHDHMEEGEWQDTFFYAIIADEWAGN